MKTLVALVGMKHRGTEALVASLPHGEPLTLVREPTNRFDPGAVMVFARGQHVGYIKASQARPVAMAMDRNGPPPPDLGTMLDGYSLAATLSVGDADHRWPMVELDL
jgi:hypothetical protein